MGTIFLYIVIMLFGIFLARKNLIPEMLKTKIAHLQTAALVFLLGILGYKLGSDSNLLSSIHLLGFQALVIAVFAIIFSILFVFIIYKKGDR